jgi:hypothetical protein
VPTVRALSLLSRPRFDVVSQYPDLAVLRKAVRAESWPAVAAHFRELPGDADPSLAVRMVGEIKGSERFLRAAAGSYPNDTLLKTLLASSFIATGWSVRTEARAKHVSPAQFAAFHDWLRRAEQLLGEVTAREPENVAAWALRLATSRGLELGQVETRRRYGEAAKARPHPLFAQIQLLQQLCPKWGGSLEQVHEFAHDCMASAPDGSLNGALVAEGHLEHASTLYDGKQRGVPHRRYLQQPHVQDELREAAARSVLHRSYRPTHGWVWAHSMFAAAWDMIGDYKSAAVHLAVLGTKADRFAWEYFADPGYAFWFARALALLKGRAQPAG